MIHPHTRRAFLGGTAAIFASAVVSRTASAAGARDPRLIVVILRGALDGLSFLAPVGDPAYGAVRGALALPSSGPEPGLPLDGFFLLNPRMPLTAGLYRKGEALLLHAVATPYRSRSHFDGQDVLESGLPDVGLRRSGWLNRLLAALPERTLARQPIGFAAGAQVPLIMRGNAPVLSWMPPAFPSGSMETKLRILDIYRHTDPKLAEILAAGLSLDERMGGEAVEGEAPGMAAKGPANIRQARAAAIAAGKLVAAPDGPRIGVLDVNGFDTHANQKPVEGVLGNLLAGIDAIVGGFEETLASVGRSRSTARRAPITAPRRRRCWSAARSRADESWPTGPGCGRPTSWTAATFGRPSTCAGS